MRDSDVILRIENLRMSRGWSVYQLAKEAELPYSTLNNLLHRTNIPTIPTLQHICDGLGITLADFFTDDVENYQVTADQIDLLEIDRALNRENRGFLRAYAKGLMQNQK